MATSHGPPESPFEERQEFHRYLGDRREIAGTDYTRDVYRTIWVEVDPEFPGLPIDIHEYATRLGYSIEHKTAGVYLLTQ